MTASTTGSLVETTTRFDACFGCAKCTSGCPVADIMDIRPHEAMRLLQLGEAETLVTAKSPWDCVGCQTCVSRCPNSVDIPSAFSQIREAAIRRGATDNAGHIPFFENLLLRSIQRSGRMNDSMLAVRYKLRAGGLLADWRLGLKLFKAGKMSLRRKKVADPSVVARLFDKPSAQEKTP